MANSIKKIKQKLLDNHLTSLTKDELILYFHYRLSNLVRESKILTSTEIKYVMSDCEQGRFRFDPQLVDKLLEYFESDDTFVIDRERSEIVVIYIILSSKILASEIAKHSGKKSGFLSGIYLDFEEIRGLLGEVLFERP